MPDWANEVLQWLALGWLVLIGFELHRSFTRAEASLHALLRRERIRDESLPDNGHLTLIEGNTSEHDDEPR